MKLLHSPTSAFTISLFFLSLLLFSSSAAADGVQYLINCGSDENTTDGSVRTFIGDVKAQLFRISGGRSETLKNTNQSSDPLYQTARVFRKRSTYHFEIPQNGTYILRFHFYPFSSSPELATAQFNVSASGLLLLSNLINFTSNSLTLKELFLRVNRTSDFRIHFVPLNLAFVNAIEVLSTSSKITEDTGPEVTPEGYRGAYNGQKFKVLETAYRINAGATKNYPVVGDELFWIPDDPFLITKDKATNATPHISVVWLLGQPTGDNAPPFVYRTAKILRSMSSNAVSNLTWQFNVTKEAMYFIRVHFCDIISHALGPNKFNIYFYRNFGERIYPFEMANNTLAAPFYKDFIVKSDDQGFLNVSIGPRGDSFDKTYMLLNGLEILQIQEGAAPDPRDDAGSSHLALIVGLVVGVVIIVLILVGVIFVHHRKRKTRPAEFFEWGITPLNAGTSPHNRILDRSPSQMSNLSNLQLGLQIPFVEIQQVTNNFDSKLIIGEGGFGKVYKGTLKNGLKVAVKRSNSDHGQGLHEFQTEITVLSKIRHYHLVSLIGYCYEGGEMILGYEFMENCSLRDHLYDSRVKSSSSSRVGLSWKQRLEICIGAAKGLDYLHTGLDSTIIHCDVKSTNILLDQNYVAKVADFGLSSSQHLEKFHVSSKVKGTPGYLDPEYFNCLQLTEKSDVYSFGVLLLEVLCARPVIDTSLPKEQINLADWAMTCYKEGCLETIIDSTITTEISPNSLKKFVEIAVKCLRDVAVKRPSMSDVLWDLEYALQLQRMTAKTNQQNGSMTDASLSLPYSVAGRLPSQSFVRDEGENVLLDPATGEVFSELSSERDGDRLH